MKKKISYQFTAIIVVATIIFSISGSLMIWKIFDVQKQQAIEFQNSVGKRLKYEFYLLSHELEYKFEQLHTLYNLFTLSSNEVSSVLSKLRSHKDETHKDVIDEIVLINNQGEIVSSSSRVHLSPEADVYSWKVIKEYFESPENVNLYYSAVLSDENGAPFIIFAVPLFDFQTGKLKGCLASKIRINLVWENLVNSSIGRRGIIYITDNNGQKRHLAEERAFSQLSQLEVLSAAARCGSSPRSTRPQRRGRSWNVWVCRRGHRLFRGRRTSRSAIWKHGLDAQG